MKDIKESKILFMDLDGTFLKNVNLDSYTKEDFESIKKYQDNGNHLVITTGRSYEQAKVVKENIYGKNSLGYLATANGAEIYKDNKLIKSSFLTSKEIIEVKDYVLSKYKNVGIKLPNESFYYSNSRKYRNLVEWFTNLDRRKNEEFNLDKKSYSKLGIILLTRKKVNYKIWEDLKEQFPNLNMFLTGHDYYIEVVKKNVSKGDVVKYISKELNISIENTYAAGDSGNDHSMFREAGNAIIMKKTPKYIIEDISQTKGKDSLFLTDSVSESGITKALKNYKLI